VSDQRKFELQEVLAEVSGSMLKLRETLLVLILDCTLRDMKEEKNVKGE
jgi:hypothetical protein